MWLTTSLTNLSYGWSASRFATRINGLKEGLKPRVDMSLSRYHEFWLEVNKKVKAALQGKEENLQRSPYEKVVMGNITGKAQSNGDKKKKVSAQESENVSKCGSNHINFSL